MEFGDPNSVPAASMAGGMGSMIGMVMRQVQQYRTDEGTGFSMDSPPSQISGGTETGSVQSQPSMRLVAEPDEEAIRVPIEIVDSGDMAEKLQLNMELNDSKTHLQFEFRYGPKLGTALLEIARI